VLPVIGTALADNPALKRQDLKLIAVLAVPLTKQPTVVNGIAGIPRQSSTNSLSSFPVSTEDDFNHNRPPFMPSSRKSSIGDEDDYSTGPFSIQTPPIGPIPSNAAAGLPPSFNLDHAPSPSATPARRISLYKTNQQSRKQQKRTVVVHTDVVCHVFVYLYGMLFLLP
jgi:hypothetical protein